STADDVLGVLQLLTLGTWLAYAGMSVTGLGNPELRKFFVFWATAVALVTAGRAIARAVCRRMPAYVQNTLIVGAGDVGQDVAAKTIQHPEFGLRVVGFVDSEPKPRLPSLDDLPLLGSLEHVTALVRELGVERVIIAFGADPHEKILALIRDLKDQPVQVDVVPRFFEMIPSTAQFHGLQSMSLVSLPPPRLSSSSLFLKRTMDLVLAAGTLVLLSPLLLLIAIAIKLESPGPVIFRQVRMGKGDRRFSVLK